MTVIQTANLDWDVLEDVSDALAAAEVAQGSPAFARVVLGATVEDFVQSTTETPAALVRPVESDPQDPGDSAADRLNLLTLEIVVRCRKADARGEAANRLQDAGKLLNLAANALMADPTRGGAAEACIIDGRLHPATRIGRSRTLDGDEGFAMAALTVTCALVHSDTDR